MSTTPGTLVGNSTVMLLSRAVTIVAGGALTIYAIRTFTVEEFGRYSIALALATTLSLLSEMGISGLAVRKITTTPKDESQLLAIAVAAEIATSAAAAALLIPVALLLGYPDEIVLLVAIAAGAVLFQGILAALQTPFQARRVMSYVAAFGALQGTATAAIGFPLLAAGTGPAGLMGAFVFGHLVALGGAVFALRRTRIHPAWGGVSKRIGGFLLAALPIALAGGADVIYERIDLLMVSKLDGIEAAEIYSVALQALIYTSLVPSIVMGAFFPLLVANLRDDPSQGQRSVMLLARIFLVLSLPLVIVLVTCGESLVTFVLGSRYSDAAVPLAIVSGSMVLGFLNYLFWYALLAAHQERAKLRILAVGLPVNAALNVILIPRYGPTGAAIALLASDLMMGLWQALIVHRRIFPVDITRIVALPGMVALGAVAAGLAVATVNPVLGGVVGVSLFTMVLLPTGYVTAEEWRPLTDPLLGIRRRMRGPR